MFLSQDPCKPFLTSRYIYIIPVSIYLVPAYLSHHKNQESHKNPELKSKATLPQSKTSKIVPRIPFYFSSLYPYKNQLNSLKNTGIKAKPTLESQMLIKLAKMIWKATKTVQN